MLILTRKPGESLYIGDDVKITIVEIKGHQIRVGIEAPKEYRIYREEIYLAILEENRKAATAATASEMEGLANLTEVWQAGKAEGPAKLEGDDKPPKKPAQPASSAFNTLRAMRVDNSEVEVIIKRKRGKKTDE